MKNTVRGNEAAVTHQANADNVHFTRDYVAEIVGWEAPSPLAAAVSIGFLVSGVGMTLGLLFWGAP